jgi:hypothetical protein
VHSEPGHTVGDDRFERVSDATIDVDVAGLVDIADAIHDAGYDVRLQCDRGRSGDVGSDVVPDIPVVAIVLIAVLVAVGDDTEPADAIDIVLDDAESELSDIEFGPVDLEHDRDGAEHLVRAEPAVTSVVDDWVRKRGDVGIADQHSVGRRNLRVATVPAVVAAR